ncbi:MAG: magnesium transporter [Spirochaetales bacterium]
MAKRPASPLTDIVRNHLHAEFLALDQSWTTGFALEHIRRLGDDRQVSYYYTVDDEGRLVGVIPVRRLLHAAPQKLLADLAIGNLVTVRDDATMEAAARAFANHKFLALPAVNDDGTIAGVLDLQALAGESLDHGDKTLVEEMFQTIGVRLESLRSGTLIDIFRTRFPWLLPTVASGFLCAWLSSRFAGTLERNLILSFFIALVLALGESISIQSMTFSFQELHKPPRERKRYALLFGRELVTALLLGLPIGLAVGALSYLLEPRFAVSLVIFGAISTSIVSACLIGLVLPWVLKALHVEPKIAAGPLVLALTDISTILVYFSLATVFLS